MKQVLLKRRIMNWGGILYSLVAGGTFVVGVALGPYYLLTKVFWMVGFLLFTMFFYNVLSKSGLLRGKLR